MRDSPLFTKEMRETLESLEKLDDKQAAKLRRLVGKARSAKKIRVLERSASLTCTVSITPTAVVPHRIEERYPDLLRVMVELAIYGSAAPDGRRTNEIICSMTLSQLHEEYVIWLFVVLIGLGLFVEDMR